MAAGNLSVVATRIVDMLASDENIQEIGSLWGVSRQSLQKLKVTISELNRVLLDSEKRSQRDNSVRDWVMKLEDVLYDADNLLQDFSTEALQRRSMAEQVPRHDFFSSVLKINKHCKEMKKVTKRLDEIEKERKLLQLEAVIDQTSWNQTCSIVNERKEGKIAIITILLSTRFEEKVAVLPIVGRAGSGKTRLAKEVYDDEKVQSHFDIQIWISVSEIFDVDKILGTILVRANGKVQNLGDIIKPKVIQLLLSRKRYLIVLDDLMNADATKWDFLKEILEAGERGSKILVTTRSRQVANLIKGTILPYHLSDLSKEQSGSLFEEMAFGNKQEHKTKDENFWRHFRTEIVQRCAGHPLAIMAMAAMLPSKSEEEWKFFYKNEFSEKGLSYNPFPFKSHSSDNAEVLPLLKLCYDHLPSPLKHCFAYCSLFPKGHEIDVQTLIKLWMAQEFIIKQSQRPLEDVGYEYFLNLLGRYFLEEVKRDATDRVTKCKMHHLMHDLAMSVTGDQCRFLSSMANDNSNSRTFHAWFDFDLSSGEDIATFDAKKIRSIVLSGQSRRRYKGVSINTIFDEIASRLLFLRALDLHASGIEIVPYSIGKLRLLKYLDLSQNEDILELPNSITELLNLQTLRLSWCFKLKRLPRDFRNLVKLRHLEINGCNNLISLPQGIGELPDLQTLSPLVVSEDSSTPTFIARKLKELKNLIVKFQINNLRLKNLRHENDVATYLKAVPSEIQWLSLDWEAHIPKSRLEEIPLNRNLLSDLEEWSTIGFRGVKLFCPVSPFPGKLVKLSLSRSANCKYLPSVDQISSLRVLVLDNLTNLEYILGGDSSSIEILQILEELWLIELPELRGWWQNTDNKLLVYYHLSKLVIEDCPNLDSLPRFPNLEGLVLVRTSWKLFELTIHQNAAAEEAPSSPTSPPPPPPPPPFSKLKNLHIVGIEDYESDKIKFKTLKNLQFLRLDCLPKMDTLPDELQQLTSLQELYLRRCVINEIPEWIGKLHNLRKLVIHLCPLLKKLPGEIRSLSNLQILEIVDCNKLLKRCKVETGADWDKISHISKKKLGQILVNDPQPFPCSEALETPEHPGQVPPNVEQSLSVSLKLSKNEKAKRKNAHSLLTEPTTQPQQNEKAIIPSSSSSARPIRSQVAENSIPHNLPRALSELYIRIRKFNSIVQVAIPMEKAIYGIDEYFLHVGNEDIIQFSELDEIGATCISFYIRYLYYEHVKKEHVHRFGFVEPSTISFVSGLTLEERSQNLADRMVVVPNEVLLLAPYNKGRHWVLLVINPRDEQVYYFDSIGKEPQKDSFNLLKGAFEKYNAKLNRSRKGNGGSWHNVKCPQQQFDSFLCGFYVMRIMRDIVMDNNVLEYMQLSCRGQEIYLVEDINQVRDEWTMHLVQEMAR